MVLERGGGSTNMHIGIYNFTHHKELVFLRRVFRIDIENIHIFHTLKVFEPERIFCVKCEFVSMPVLIRKTKKGHEPVRNICRIREKFVKIALTNESENKINLSNYHFVGKLLKLSTVEDFDNKGRVCTYDVNAIEISRIERKEE